MTEACRFELVEGNHFATCQTHAPICMDDFSELLRAQVCTIGLAELRIQLAMRTGWQRCDTHGEINADHAWGCPECVREMRNHLDAIATWSPVSGAPCPLCTSAQGKLMTSCEWHREVEAQARVIERLREALSMIQVSGVQPCLSIKTGLLTVFFYYSDMEDRGGVAREVLDAFKAERDLREVWTNEDAL